MQLSLTLARSLVCSVRLSTGHKQGSVFRSKLGTHWPESFLFDRLEHEALLFWGLETQVSAKLSMPYKPKHRP